MDSASTDPFLEHCREERAVYARYLEACESGQLHIGDGRPGGGISDRTAAYANHLRLIIADLDTLIEAMERDDA